MIKITKEQKQELVKKGWLLLDNLLLLADKETHLVETINITSKDNIVQLLNYYKQTQSKDISEEDYINTMCEIANIERGLNLYEKNNAKIGL